MNIRTWIGCSLLSLCALGGCSGPDSSAIETRRSALDADPPVMPEFLSTIFENGSDTVGKVVNYGDPGDATDAVDGPVPIICTPASGSFFPLGPTLVVCTATDSSGNTATATFTIFIRAPDGTPCGITKQCNSDFCVDGRCCATECLGGADDCQACSIAAGGTADGTCTPRTAGAACANDGNLCSTDTCNGTSVACQHSAGNAGVECAPAGPCENPGLCVASSTACPGTTAIANCTFEAIDPGTNVPVEVNGGLDTVGGALIIFSKVTSDGDVTLTDTTVGPPPPLEYGLVPGTPAHYFDIDTTAGYPSGADIIVCLHYDQNWLPDLDHDGVGDECTPSPPMEDECGLKLVHYDSGSGYSFLPAPPPASGLDALDTVGNVICGLTHSLSPFALAVPLDKTGPLFAGVPDTITAYATSTQGANVNYTTPTATDAADGPVDVSCAPESGSQFKPGTTTVACTAADTHGNPASTTFTVWVQYQAPDNGTFFLDPINANGSSIFKKGSTVPVKFKLQGTSAGIKNLVAHLSVAKVSNGIEGTSVEAVSTSAADNGNVFRADSSGNQYIFNLSTKLLSTGTWSLRADLGDEVTHQVNVSLK